MSWEMLLLIPLMVGLLAIAGWDIWLAVRRRWGKLKPDDLTPSERFARWYSNRRDRPE